MDPMEFSVTGSIRATNAVAAIHAKDGCQAARAGSGLASWIMEESLHLLVPPLDGFECLAGLPWVRMITIEATRFATGLTGVVAISVSLSSMN